MLKHTPNFGSCDHVICEDDYVKVPRKKYERDKFWRYIDYTAVASVIIYWLYKAFKNSGKPPLP